MNLNLIGTDENGVKCTLPNPFWLNLQRSVSAPADALTLTFINCDIPDVCFCEISGDITFYGVVDTISRKNDSSGSKTVMYCRSIVAMLLDCQEMPGKSVNPNIDVLAITHTCGGRLKGFLYDSYTPVSVLNATSSMSQWAYLCLFCEQTMGRTPHITPDRYISTKPYDGSVKHNLDNCIACETTTDYSDIVTSVSVKNPEGAYSMSMVNPNFPAVFSRHRYVTPGIGWQNYPEQYGYRVLSQSMLNYKTKTLTLSGFLALDLGQTGVYKGEEKAIIEIEYLLDQNGAKTKVTLGEREYL